ncbi:MAG TPA: hypothetical protein VMH49_02460 [Thermoplasmata archaeon]|nr:hypothetical protein [Thermoplasmata archaeon]
MGELGELADELRRERDAEVAQAAGELLGAAPAALDRGGDGRRELLEERLRLDLELLPLGAARELAELLLALGDAARGDPEACELGEALVDVVLDAFGGLAPLPQRVGLLLKDPRQAGRREGPEAPLTGRRSPP